MDKETKERLLKELMEKTRKIAEDEKQKRCSWCGEFLPKGELLDETDLGPICRRCANAIRSRGERLTIEDER